MKKWQQEKESKLTIKKHLVLKVIFAVVICLLGLQIFVSNTVSTSGDQLQMLEQRYTLLSSQNEYLKKQIALVSSLSRIQKEAEALGFGNNDSVVYLTNSINVARK